MADIFVSSESERLVQLEIENVDKQIYARTAIPNTDKKLIIKIDSYNNNCLVDIAVTGEGDEVADTIVHIDNFDHPNELLTAIYSTEEDEPKTIFKQKI
jgi:hypothetical protein